MVPRGVVADAGCLGNQYPMEDLFLLSVTGRIVILTLSCVIFYIIEAVNGSGDWLYFPLYTGYQEAQDQIFGQLPTTVSLNATSVFLGFRFISYFHFLFAQHFLLAHSKTFFPL